jgi:hypothetical protein
MKKVRAFVYITQVFLTIILIMIFTAISPNAEFDPLYLPFEVYFLIVFVMILIINAESILFKFIGIRWAKTDSEKFLLARNHSRTAVVIVAGAILIMVAIIFLTPTFDEGLDTSKTVVFEDKYMVNFTSQDPFAITGVTRISVSSEEGIPLTVYIIEKEDFQFEVYENRLNFDNNQSIGVTNITYQSDDFLPHGDYVVYMDSSGNAAKVTYSIEGEVSPNFIPFFTIFPIIFAVLNIVWIIYLNPMKKKFKKESIYK